MPAATLISASEFDRLAETDERRLEFFDGEVIEVSSARPRHRVVVVKVIVLLELLAQSPFRGTVFADTEFQIGPNRRFIPDVAFVSAPRSSQIDLDRTPIDLLPDLAVEVISPSESAEQVDRKIDAYLEAGVTEVWAIVPGTLHIFIHTVNDTRKLRIHQELTSEVFPGWAAPVESIFDIGS